MSAGGPAPVIEVRGLGVRFADHWVLRDLDLRVGAGEMVSLVGGSGSGKTTLLRHLLGLVRPACGEIRLFGEPLFGGGRRREQALRRRFGVLFQHGALFSALTVFDNVAFPLRELRCLDEALIRDLVMLKLDMVELLPRHAALLPAELSGGMIKRVALARALALDPELLILDEPTAGLDPDLADGFVELVTALRRELGLTVLIVTHDLETLVGLSSHVAVLAGQRLVAYGTLAEVMAVDHPFIRGFFHSARGRRVLEGQALG